MVDQKTATNNWITAFNDDPEQTKTVIRNMLEEPKNRLLLKKSLRNRVVRWQLKRRGALTIVERELEKADEKQGQPQNNG